MMQETNGMRRVRLIKIEGENSKGIKPLKSMIGFEKGPPRVGQSYRVFLEEGGVFVSSTVKWHSLGFIHTLNTLYKVEELSAKP